ncbi:aminodeoxychorismate synthase component I [Leptospira langatensis]|uniref:Aminodeoxychorismate synthase component I n=1 Tax=Leptospira langatensis TaxID=2484983 RepID=A0A5F1ZT99_9LEPT|nr:aminodeoxychorismate synthase component I [Leptospira langatensis]TGK03013.1 aminodeoxychorismate synthase component I [Leptospira langatensis]TGL41769.1 aminodeoxychorismate synthase component I [Leptospira langatensis]
MIPDLRNNPDRPFIFLGSGFSSEGIPIIAEPNEILTTNRRSEVRKILLEIQDRIAKGNFAAGWISYEVGELFLNEDYENGSEFRSEPLLWFGVFQKYHKVKAEELISWEEKFQDRGYFAALDPSLEQKEYKEAIRKIQDYLYKGEVYQVNYTFPLRIRQEGSLEKLFFDLRKKQSVPYEAWIRTGNSIVGGHRDILSFSPELFWERKGNEIRTVPMKGTRARGKDSIEDEKLREELFESAKDRAENLMITDLLRNDLGRISELGSVQVSKLFSVEEYSTVFQMTSEVRSLLPKEINWMRILESLFPGGSITGAPKKRAVEIIRELEKERGVYTGGIFFLSPEKETVSIAIRTLEFLETSPGRRTGRMGIGSGITIGSDAEIEWKECWSKAKFLKDPIEAKNSFYIFTTMLCKRGTIFFLKDHKERMRSSASQLGFEWKESEWELSVQTILEQNRSKKGKASRIRIQLFGDGTIRTEISEFVKGPKQGNILFSKTQLDRSDPFLYHKTNIRETYSFEYEKALAKGYLDVIYSNQEGQITEGAIHSIFFFLDGEWITPALDQGLLPGVARKRWIQKLHAREGTVLKKDLELAEKILLVNSIRGARRVLGVDQE